MASSITRKGILDFQTKGTSKAKGEVGGLDSAMGSLKGAVMGAVSAYAALQVIQTSMAWGEEAAKVRDVESAFESMAKSAGIDSVAMLEKMRAATNRTVTDLGLMQQANTAMMLGLPVERFDEMLSIARGAAISTGQSMEFMLQSMVTGLGRQSAQIIDNLGITLSAEKANEDYAASIGKTVAQLTEQERKQAFVNAALDIGAANLEKMGGLQKSNVDGYQQMRVAMDQIKVSLGELVPSMDLLGLSMIGVADGLDEALPRLKMFQAASNMLVYALSGPLGVGAITRSMFNELSGANARGESEKAVKAFGENMKAYHVTQAEKAGEAAAQALAHAFQLQLQESEFAEGMDFGTILGGSSEIPPEQLAAGYDLDKIQEYTEANRELFEISGTGYPEMAESVSWFADVTDQALGRVIWKNQAVVASLKNLIIAQNISTKSVGMAVQAAVRAELAGAAAMAIVDAAKYTYKGIAATASMLGGNPLGAGVAQAYFTAAGKAAAVAGIAAAGASIGPSMSTPSYSPVSGEYGDAGGSSGGTERNVHVTRTAPTTITVTHIYNGPVNFGSQDESTAIALQGVLDSGELYLPGEVA